MTEKATSDAMALGRTGIDNLDGAEFNGSPYKKGAQIKTYRPRELVADRKLLKLLGRHDVFGLNAAKQAIEDSQVIDYRETLSDPVSFNERFGVYVGSPGNKFFQQYDFMPLLASAKGDMKAFAQHLFEKVHPMWLLKILPNNVLAYTGIQYGFKGPNENITNHVVGGLQALSEAYDAIRFGEADRAVVVSYDMAFEAQQLNYYGRLGILSDTMLTPFDVSHDGTVLAEGAAALVLESEASVKERGAEPYAEILSSSTKSDAEGLFSIEEEATTLTKTFSDTLEKADVAASEVGMITAHGNGNQKSDLSEALAFSRLFKQTPVTGFKWATGHLLCASGVMDTLFTCKALKEGVVPGIANLKELAPGCEDLSVSNNNQPLGAAHALVVSRGFGGLNTSLMLKACTGE